MYFYRNPINSSILNLASFKEIQNTPKTINKTPSTPIVVTFSLKNKLTISKVNRGAVASNATTTYASWDLRTCNISKFVKKIVKNTYVIIFKKSPFDKKDMSLIMDVWLNKEYAATINA